MSSSKRLHDVVATWEVSLSDGIHKVEFEHGTTSGKRAIWVDGKNIFKKEWMFKLVGHESFKIGRQGVKAVINIDACNGFSYEYSITVGGKSLKKFQENKDQTTKSWGFELGGVKSRVVLEKDTMDVWCNGEKMETTGEFTDDGTETHFEINDHFCFIRAVTSGNKRCGIIHSLYVDDKIIADDIE